MSSSIDISKIPVLSNQSNYQAWAMEVAVVLISFVIHSGDIVLTFMNLLLGFVVPLRVRFYSWGTSWGLLLND